MENAEQINDMLDSILGGDNIGAQDVFNNLIAAKVTQAIDAKKQEVANSLYADNSKVEDGTEQEEEPAEASSDDSAV